MSVESVSQARSAREDRCYQEVARWDVRVNLPMSPSGSYVLPPGCILCGGTRVSTTVPTNGDEIGTTQCRSEVTKRSADLIEIRKGAINLQPVKVSLLPESSSCQIVVALQRIE